MSTVTHGPRASTLTGIERHFGADEIIVSKTDTKGRITYANRTFLRVAEYSERELLGAPHSIIRHPDMPGCVFQLLWETISSGDEIFAYVVNRTKSGGHYWVLAHVTPTFDEAGEIVGYHSNRRNPTRQAVTAAEGLYACLRSIEDGAASPASGRKAARAHLDSVLRDAGVSYGEFVFSL
ncbi:MAG: PAS domain-containing protein [Planctomycetota bacterium]